ncbi:TKL family protein kinase [Trichomonas vaginalis G3]|uniref:TKL family protein kinase n=1 Tax=Trichomonas vaginalis (strain ATCC PRA-98 / G3) TaxID=412133 RepID=A2EV55_TRIV3|nr:TKL family protein kinase [Trichomonas vaginalis G3]EAY03438.1 TKL family protein kinase [Trichomonas vaginalis G3]KAI5486167.1 TKL family protein kinase [Trichomonas vaginalis G3]|eukprot:XP_001315661.1 TKL family protein kinase [Trichomonas vaginalis G3]
MFKKIGITDYKHLESGTFFMVFQGKIQNSNVVLKAYEYTAEIISLEEAKRSLDFFTKLEEYSLNLPGIVKYTDLKCEGTTAFLIRPKFQTSLEDLLVFQEPPITMVEKQWIAYQVCIILLRLHQSGLYHSDLKPSNIFVSDSFFTYVTDLAPYKPETISPNRMNLYYHFFTTSSTSGYYLAPERFTNEQKKIDMKAADLFSLGCVLYFIFSDGKHLFDVMSGLKYGCGEDTISDKLSKVADEKMRNLIKSLISLDITKRLEAENMILQSFSEQMKVLFDMFRSFSLNNDFDANTDAEKLLDVAKLGDDDYKIIVIDYMNDIIQRDLFTSNFYVFFDAYTQIVKPIPDDFKVIRCIPTLSLLIEKYDSPSLHSRVLQVIYEMLSTIHSVPREFRGIFASFLNPLLEKASNRSERTRDIIASFLPKYACELERLTPMTYERIAIDFSFITTTDNINVFTIFTESLIAQSSHGIRLLNTFLFSLLSMFNFTEESFKIITMKVFVAFYENSAPNEIRFFSEQCNESILPVCQDLLSRNISNGLLIAILDLLDVAFSRGMAEKTYGYALLPKFNELSSSTDTEVRYKTRKLMYMFPRPITATLFTDPGQFIDMSYKNSKAVRKNIYTSPGNVVTCPIVKPNFCRVFRRDNQPINFIDGIGTTDNYVVLLGDNKIMYLNTKDTNTMDIDLNRTKLLKNKATAMAALENSLVVGHDNGEIYLIDHKLFQKTLIETGNAPVKSILALNDTNFIAGFNDGMISLIDTRENNSKNTFSFTGINDISVLSHVYGVENVAAIGFGEGVVSLFDARVMKPVWLSTCPPVNHLVHLESPSNGCSFCVVSDSSAYVITEPTHTSLSSIPVTNVVAAPYKGAAIVCSNNGALLMHTSQCFDLYDNGVYPVGTPRHDCPLTPHTAKLTSMCVHKSALITGDEAGFINFCKLARRRQSSGSGDPVTEQDE